MSTTMQEILNNQKQVEEEVNQLNQIKSTYGALIDGYKILNTYEPFEDYDPKLFKNFQQLIALDINKDLKQIKNLTDNLNEDRLKIWFAALENKHKYFSAKSKVQIKHVIAASIPPIVFLSALVTGYALTGVLGVSVFIAGVIVAALISVIENRYFYKPIKENNRAASEISESKKDFVSFFKFQKLISQNENGIKIETQLTPVQHS